MRIENKKKTIETRYFDSIQELEEFANDFLQRNHVINVFLDRGNSYVLCYSPPLGLKEKIRVAKILKEI